jgi:hypothetical protein
MANPFPFVAGEILTAADMNGIGEFISYTPILTATTTNPTLGIGAITSGGYWRVNQLVIYRFAVIFGSSGVVPGVGNYQISLPVTAALFGNYYMQVGGGTSFFDSSANAPYFANSWIETSTKLSILYQTGFNDTLNNVTATTPVVPSALDSISGYVIYGAA